VIVASRAADQCTDQSTNLILIYTKLLYVFVKSVLWSAFGQPLVSLWSAFGQPLVSLWSAFGQPLVSRTRDNN
jgi:hypothetical protein